MNERELQDYLFEHPELLFPGSRVQEKAREYAIHGRRIDLLFVVDGTRYIVEFKGVPLQRDHIGQVVEYYGLMKKYLKEANLRMILVAPSIPEWRGRYLEELGIRCVELSEVPADP
jgi:RecB family endonuclease NucS